MPRASTAPCTSARLLRKDFPDHCAKRTGILRDQAKAQAERDGVPILHLNNPSTDQEATALELARQHQRTSGRLALLTCQEGAQPQPIAPRLENTFNNVADFKTFRTKEGEKEDAPKSWQALRKGVADRGRRADIGQASNHRLAESLATVAAATPLGQLLEPLGRPVLHEGRRVARALHPLTGADGNLLRVLAHGDFQSNGFRNRDLRARLSGASSDPAQRRRPAAAITRLLALVRAHGLIVKVRQTHRYQLSAEGKRITAALLAAHAADITPPSDAA